MSSVPNSQDVGIDLESLAPPPRGRNGGYHTALSNIHRTHSRSASWSLPSVQNARPVEFGRGLASFNPMTPITNVIREIVPSFGQTSRSSESNGGGSPHVSRDPSQNSLLLGPSEVEGGPIPGPVNEAQQGHSMTGGHGSLRTLGDSSSNVNVHLPREHVAVHMGSQGPPEEPNMGLDFSDSMRWLEHNLIFFILLLVKFSWYHRSGEL